MEQSEEALQAYRDKEDLVDISGIKTIALRELNEITENLGLARRQRTNAENIVTQVNKLNNRNIEALSAIPAVLEHSLVQRFKEAEGRAEQQLQELSKRYGPLHPKIIAARSDLKVAKENTAKQIRKVIEGIQKEYEVTKATEASLEQELVELKKEVQIINRKEYRLNELTREVQVNRQLYDTFFNRIKETSETGDMLQAHARVVDKAIVPIHPIKPQKTILSIASLIISGIVAIMLVFIREALDRTVKSREDVLVKLGTQLLGVLPLLAKDSYTESDIALIYINKSSNKFSESIRTIRTGVVLSGLDNPHKIMLVTSSVPGEGKTTTSANLAAAFGQMGRVLLIDADMRRPSISKVFGISNSKPGLSNLVAETAEPKDCIYRLAEVGIDVIPAGVVPPNPLELLSSKRFASVLSGLEKHYDRIIIDTAPTEVVSDALILSTYADAVIYVVKADATNIKVVKSGLSRMLDSGAPITGVVLNQVDLERRQNYYGYGYDYYYGGYYDYYGYSSKSPSGGSDGKSSGKSYSASYSKNYSNKLKEKMARRRQEPKVPEPGDGPENQA
jgi:capsular exopolysaccharide synthesis family protein